MSEHRVFRLRPHVDVGYPTDRLIRCLQHVSKFGYPPGKEPFGANVPPYVWEFLSKSPYAAVNKLTGELRTVVGGYPVHVHVSIGGLFRAYTALASVHSSVDESTETRGTLDDECVEVTNGSESQCA